MTVVTTHSGFFNLDTPEPESILIEDIARSLSHICRYNGHPEHHYSVAQHSVIMSHLVDSDFAFEALMHDAHEAYIGDIARPVRMKLGEALRELEETAWKAVAERFGLPLAMSPEVKWIDDLMIVIEKQALLPNHKDDLPGTEHLANVEIPGEVQIERLHPGEAASRFLERYHELCPVMGADKDLVSPSGAWRQSSDPVAS